MKVAGYIRVSIQAQVQKGESLIHHSSFDPFFLFCKPKILVAI